MLALPPLSLYVHIPWCVKKCPYCDFNSHESKVALPESDYINALTQDFDRDYAHVQNRPITSIFIGGGTPSLFSAAAIEKLLNHIQKKATLASDVEITLEANPGTAESARFKGFRQSGVNRLSMGIQSLTDKHLSTLGRIHNAAQAKDAIHIAAQAGFDNFNLDIMHGLPDQSEEEALADLRSALAFAPKHLSWYQLTIEPNTAFYKRPPSLPVDDVLSTIQIAGEELLREHGFEHYEVSAFSTKGFHSTHNTNYWRFGDYLGIGAGAHGKITLSKSDEVIRLRKHKQPNHYLNSPTNYIAEKVLVPSAQRPLEFLMNALRLKNGFLETEFEAYTGVAFDSIRKKVDSLVNNGLLEHENKRIAPSTKGFRFLNNILEEFL